MNLPKLYDPSAYEDDIYALWERSAAFDPGHSKTAYSIVMPPPNANGNLHIGHALTVALEDTAVRYHRLKGEAALLLPGADHAGFETQSVYEKQLA
jgi:valyl-tRNA synthetase